MSGYANTENVFYCLSSSGSNHTNYSFIGWPQQHVLSVGYFDVTRHLTNTTVTVRRAGNIVKSMMSEGNNSLLPVNVVINFV